MLNKPSPAICWLRTSLSIECADPVLWPALWWLGTPQLPVRRGGRYCLSPAAWPVPNSGHWRAAGRTESWPGRGNRRDTSPAAASAHAQVQLSPHIIPGPWRGQEGTAGACRTGGAPSCAVGAAGGVVPLRSAPLGRGLPALLTGARRSWVWVRPRDARGRQGPAWQHGGPGPLRGRPGGRLGPRLFLSLSAPRAPASPQAPGLELPDCEPKSTFPSTS